MNLKDVPRKKEDPTEEKIKEISSKIYYYDEEGGKIHGVVSHNTEGGIFVRVSEAENDGRLRMYGVTLDKNDFDLENPEKDAYGYDRYPLKDGVLETKEVSFLRISKNGEEIDIFRIIDPKTDQLDPVKTGIKLGDFERDEKNIFIYVGRNDGKDYAIIINASDPSKELEGGGQQYDLEKYSENEVVEIKTRPMFRGFTRTPKIGENITGGDNFCVRTITSTGTTLGDLQKQQQQEKEEKTTQKLNVQ